MKAAIMICMAAATFAAGCATSASGSSADNASNKPLDPDNAVLPSPQKSGGPGLFEIMQKRGSAAQASFPSGKLSASDISTLLWAASGKNRDGSKWTVPIAMGKPPYTKVFLATEEGAFSYDYDNHTIKPITKSNILADIATQPFARNASATMVFVTDGEELGKMSNSAWADEFGVMLAGAMSQNVYLASEALGIGARLVYSVDRDKTRELLQLGPKDKVICAVLLGKRQK